MGALLSQTLPRFLPTDSHDDAEQYDQEQYCQENGDYVVGHPMLPVIIL